MATSATRAFLSLPTTTHHRRHHHNHHHQSSSSFSRHLITVSPITGPSFSHNNNRSCSNSGIGGSCCGGGGGRLGVRCLVSGVDGGGVSDDFVASTRKSVSGNEFSVIAKLLLQIKPLDNSVISQGVSDSAKDSMKQTISTMLGLLPSDRFDVVVRVSKRPLYQLLVSLVITGYTLWNAEYRIALIRNFDIPNGTSESMNCVKEFECSEEACTEGCDMEGHEVGVVTCFENSDKLSDQIYANLSPEALKYIQQLESDLSSAQKELNTRKEESVRAESEKNDDNDLLEYLRSLESHMVTELSRPSSLEVEEIVQQLVQSITHKIIKDNTASNITIGPAIAKAEKRKDEVHDDAEFSYTISPSRDYLAKLLFWCMLLGHHLRGLENRLHLTCAVGLL